MPAELQVTLERFLIAGFLLCLSLLVVSGVIIGMEAYEMATSGQLPKDLDEFLVKVLSSLSANTRV